MTSFDSRKAPYLLTDRRNLKLEEWGYMSCQTLGADIFTSNWSTWFLI